MVDLSTIKPELSEEQIKQLNEGIGSVMRPTDIFELGWNSALRKVSEILGLEFNP